MINAKITRVIFAFTRFLKHLYYNVLKMNSLSIYALSFTCADLFFIWGFKVGFVILLTNL